MIDLLTLFDLIHKCNLLAETMFLPFDTAKTCSEIYEYILGNYFNNDYEAYKIAYEKFVADYYTPH